MIDAKQLRLGNWIYGVNGFSARIRAYDFEHTDFDKCNPIPLSPEILEKCGFEKTDNSNKYWSFWRLKNGWYISESHHNEPSAGVNKGLFYYGDEYIEIKHLHHLQNFYFAHTQRELQITL